MEYKELSNGLKYCLVPQAEAKSVTVFVTVNAGSKYETKKISGISHVLEHMAFKGTEKRPSAKIIARELDSMGGAYNAFTSKDTTAYFVKVAPQFLKRAADVIFDIYLHSKLESKELKREKSVIVQEMKMVKDDPRSYVNDLLENLLYKNQPAGWDIIGTEESVNGLTQEDIFNYRRSLYQPNNTVLTIAGNINVEHVDKLVKEALGLDRAQDIAKKPKVKEEQSKPESLFFAKDTHESHLAIAFRAVNYFSPKRDVLDLLSNILGGYMSSRLFMEVREKRGLAYYVFADTDFNPETGYLYIKTGVEPQNTKKAVTVILNECEKIKTSLSDVEFKRAKDNLRGRFILSLEDSSALAGFYAGQLAWDGSVKTPEQRLAEFDAITKDEVMQAAKEFLIPKRANLAYIAKDQPEGFDFVNLTKLIK